MTKIEYLSLSKFERFLVSFGRFFSGIGKGFVNFFRKMPSFFMKLWMSITGPFYVLKEAMVGGNWITRVNFIICGFAQLFRKQIARGILYLAYEGVFIWFLIVVGVPNLSKLGNLGSFGPAKYLTFSTSTSSFISEAVGGSDSSFSILLYSLVTILLMGIFVVLWYFSIRDAKSLQDSESVGRFSKNSDFVKDMTGKSYQNLLLAIPMVGLVAFTIIPIIFMIIVGFTNYTSIHTDLFDWVGFKNYSNLFGGMSEGGSNDVAIVFLKVLAWTLIWAFFATFTNYFLGMVVALLINKKGIKLKKLWRTILITTIAVPQFVSLLLVSQMFKTNGIISQLFMTWGWIPQKFAMLDDPLIAKVIIIIVNMWVGIPYTMLICSGILMNIPEDLYESARIDGASPFKMYMKITLPYMLFITGPYLISSFVGNINNFNVIYLLTGGGPNFKAEIPAQYGTPGETDLLITWIYKICMNNQKDYASASVIGVLIFVVVAVFSFIFYGRSNAVKNEEDFQ